MIGKLIKDIVRAPFEATKAIVEETVALPGELLDAAESGMDRAMEPNRKKKVDE